MELAHELAKETTPDPPVALHEHPAGATELFRFLDEPGSSPKEWGDRPRRASYPRQPPIVAPAFFLM